MTLRKLVDAAIVKVAGVTWILADEDEVGGLRFGPDFLTLEGPDGIIAGASDLVSQALRPRRRAVTPEFLASVAKVYLADTKGKPTMAVQKRLNGSHRTATRWVSLARKAGLIPPVRRKTSTKETDK